MYRDDPDWSALQSARVVEVPFCVTRRVTFRTSGHFFSQVFSALNLRLIGRRSIGGGRFEGFGGSNDCYRQQNHRDSAQVESFSHLILVALFAECVQQIIQRSKQFFRTPQLAAVDDACKMRVSHLANFAKGEL
jgi:hypothetical protein